MINGTEIASIIRKAFSNIEINYAYNIFLVWMYEVLQTCSLCNIWVFICLLNLRPWTTLL